MFLNRGIDFCAACCFAHRTSSYETSFVPESTLLFRCGVAHPAAPQQPTSKMACKAKIPPGINKIHWPVRTASVIAQIAMPARKMRIKCQFFKSVVMFFMSFMVCRSLNNNKDGVFFVCPCVTLVTIKTDFSVSI